jgi:hypothetical protein
MVKGKGRSAPKSEDPETVTRDMMVANIFYHSIKDVQDTKARVVTAAGKLFTQKGREDPEFLTFIMNQRNEKEIISLIADLSAEKEAMEAYIWAENELEAQKSRPSPGIQSILNAYQDTKFTHRFAVGYQFHFYAESLEKLREKIMTEIGTVAKGGVRKEDVVNQLRSLAKHVLKDAEKKEETKEDDNAR